MADVGEIAKTLSLVSSDGDNYRNAYKTTELQPNGDIVSIVFTAPSFAIFDKYRFYILQHCKLKDMTIRHKYRPDYLSYDEYGTTNWWQLLLYINDIPTIQEFDREKILVPTLECIGTLESEATSMRNVNNINEDHLNNNQKAILYSPHTYKTNITLTDTIKALTEKPSSIADRMKREEFLMDISTLRLRYIDLEYPAIENSINLVVRGKPNYIYGKHYLLTSSTGNIMNRITWDPNIVKGSGLVFRLKEKDIIQVTYVSR